MLLGRTGGQSLGTLKRNNTYELASVLKALMAKI
jgi:hypothetical protein